MAEHTKIVINEENITDHPQENVNVNINSDSDTIANKPVAIELDDINNESLESKWLRNMANESVAKYLQLVESGKKELLLASEHRSSIKKINNLLQENQIVIIENKLTIEKNTLKENVKSHAQYHHKRGEENQEIINKNDKNSVGDDIQDVQIKSSVFIESKDEVMTADVIVDGELLNTINETDSLKNDTESENLKDIIRPMTDDRNDRNSDMPEVQIESSIIIESKDEIMTADAIVEHGQLLKTINKNETESLKNDAESENLKDVIHHTLLVIIDSIAGEFDNQKIIENLLLLISKINSNNKNMNDKEFVDAQQTSSLIFTDANEQHLQDDDNVLIENDAFENITDVKNNTSNENDEPLVMVSKCGDEPIADIKMISVLENQYNETLSTRFSTSSTDDRYENGDTNSINSEEILETNENNTLSRMVNVSVQTISTEPSYRSFFIYWILNIIFIIFIVIITILFVCHLLIRSHIFDCPSGSHNSSNSIAASHQL